MSLESAADPSLSNAAPRTDPPLDAVRAILRDLVVPIAEFEEIEVRAAGGRILCNDVISPIDVPAHDNAAMDGYALRGEDLATTGPTTLTAAGIALAGRPHDSYVASGSCVRIMTGAVMPAPCDTVVAQEHCRLEGAMLVIEQNPEPGQNCRHRGEDLRAGQMALAAGRRITPADQGLLASLGIARVGVTRRPRVAFFSTGDELRSLGEPLEEGCVYDSNRYTLHGMLSALPVEIIDLGVVRDTPEAVAAALAAAVERADAVITSGGVSMGDADYLRAAVLAQGELVVESVAMKPGRPMAAGRLARGGHASLYFGLPGNPVAVMVTFYLLVRDALLRLAGAHAGAIVPLRLRAQHPLRKGRRRTEVLRAFASATELGWSVRTTGSQGSGVLRSMSDANCLLVLEHDRGDVAAGEWVEALPLYGLL